MTIGNNTARTLRSIQNDLVEIRELLVKNKSKELQFELLEKLVLILQKQTTSTTVIETLNLLLRNHRISSIEEQLVKKTIKVIKDKEHIDLYQYIELLDTYTGTGIIFDYIRPGINLADEILNINISGGLRNLLAVSTFLNRLMIRRLYD